jgi:hypothetical protein
MKANGSKFASLGPLKAVTKPVTFQRVFISLYMAERGKTAHAYAASFKFAPATWQDGGPA